MWAETWSLSSHFKKSLVFPFYSDKGLWREMSVIRFYTTQFLYFLFPCQSSDWNREWWSMSEMNVNTMYVILDRWFLFFSTCNIYLPSPTFAAHTVGYWVENPEWSNSMISCSVLRTCWKLVDQRIFCYEDKSRNLIKGELRPEIFLLHMKVLTLIKAKSNVFLWYVQCCSCTRRSKTKILSLTLWRHNVKLKVLPTV